MISRARVINITSLANLKILPILNSGKDWDIVILKEKLLFARRRKRKKVARVIYPIPPICRSSKIMPLPTGVKNPWVSFTIRPVTHTAEVEVKNASVNERLPLLVQGKSKSNAPTIITPIYPDKRI